MQLAGSDGDGYPSGGTLLGPFSDLSLYKTKSPVPRAIRHVGCICNSFLAKGNQKKKNNSQAASSMGWELSVVVFFPFQVVRFKLGCSNLIFKQLTPTVVSQLFQYACGPTIILFFCFWRQKNIWHCFSS